MGPKMTVDLNGRRVCRHHLFCGARLVPNLRVVTLRSRGLRAVKAKTEEYCFHGLIHWTGPETTRCICQTDPLSKRQIIVSIAASEP